jgi:hypothetical protein
MSSRRTTGEVLLMATSSVPQMVPLSSAQQLLVEMWLALQSLAMEPLATLLSELSLAMWMSAK